MEDKRLTALARLLQVMDDLREKCPWDREQTFLSLRNNTIEECFELVDALTEENMAHICEPNSLIDLRAAASNLTSLAP